MPDETMRIAMVQQNPLGYQQLTSLSAATALTVPNASTASSSAIPTRALLTAESQHVRWRDDGTDPQAGVGQLIKTTDPPFEYVGDLKRLRFIEVTGSAKLNVCYYGG